MRLPNSSITVPDESTVGYRCRASNSLVSCIIQAVDDENIEEVESLLNEFQVDLSRCLDASGNNCLVRSCLNNNSLAVVEYLLDKLPVDSIEKGSGKTPLMLCVMRNNLDLVELLLQHGADPNAKDNKYQFSALHLSVQYLARVTAERLMEKPAEEDEEVCFTSLAKTRSSKQTLSSAQAYQTPGNSSIASEMPVKRSAANELIQAVTESKESEIQQLFDSTALRVIDLLIKKGADTEAKDVFGNNASHWARESGFRFMAGALSRSVPELPAARNLTMKEQVKVLYKYRVSKQYPVLTGIKGVGKKGKKKAKRGKKSKR